MPKLTFQTIENADAPVRVSLADRDGVVTNYVLSAPVGEEISMESSYFNHYVIKPPKSTKSFKKISREGEIKMTPYSVGKIITSDLLVRTPDQKGSVVSKATYTCEAGNISNHYFTGYHPMIVKFDRVDSFKTLVDRGVHLHRLDYKQKHNLEKEMNNVKSNVISDSMSGFDALTNLAEFPETLEMLLTALKNARHPLTGIKELISKYKKAKKDKKTSAEINADLSGQWMQYRYGIMPLVLSIRDAIELLDKQLAEFHTVHSGYTANVSDTSKPEGNLEIGDYLYQNAVGTIKVRATGKARYSTPGLRLSDLITINPFLTAWELIPMSFVIDWFVNVGDVIFSSTSGLVDLATERKFCISVKEDITVKTLYHVSKDRSYHYKTDGWPLPLRPCGLARPAYEYSSPLNFKRDLLVREQNIETYDRVLFNSTDVEFEFLPSLSWMRMLDGYVLSFKHIAKALKKLS